MSGDRIVALIGLAMALFLVLTNLRLRQEPIGAKVWISGAWVAIILAAAVLFSGFQR